MIFIATDKITNYQATGRFSLGAGGGGAKVGKELWRGRNQAVCYQTLLQQIVGGGVLNVAKLDNNQQSPVSIDTKLLFFTTTAPC